MFGSALVLGMFWSLHTIGSPPAAANELTRPGNPSPPRDAVQPPRPAAAAAVAPRGLAARPPFTLVTSSFGGYADRYAEANQLKHCYALRHGYQHIFDTTAPPPIPANATKHDWINQV